MFLHNVQAFSKVIALRLVRTWASLPPTHMLLSVQRWIQGNVHEHFWICFFLNTLSDTAPKFQVTWPSQFQHLSPHLSEIMNSALFLLSCSAFWLHPVRSQDHCRIHLTCSPSFKGHNLTVLFFKWLKTLFCMFCRLLYLFKVGRAFPVVFTPLRPKVGVLPYFKICIY